jgi:tetratricopeptide (TPR) repeat protein
LGKAANDFERAIEIKPDYPQAHLNLGQVHDYWWQGDAKQEDFTIARDQYLQAAQADKTPNHWVSILAYWNLGWLDYLAGNYEEAIAVTQHAIDMNPDDQAPRDELALVCNLGLYYLATSNPISATVTYDSALAFAAAYPTAQVTDKLATCREDLDGLLRERADLTTAAAPILDKIGAAEKNLPAQKEAP